MYDVVYNINSIIVTNNKSDLTAVTVYI